MQVHCFTLVVVRNSGACGAAKLEGGTVEGGEASPRAVCTEVQAA